MMKRSRKCLVSMCVVLLAIGVFSSGFWGSTKKDIDVKGVKSLAIAPFEYTHFKDFSEESGEIVAEKMNEIIADKVEWKCIPVEDVKAAMEELKFDYKKIMNAEQAAELGKKLEVDLVIVGTLPVYDEKESASEILEKGGGFTENTREVDVEYDMFFIKVSDGSLIKNVKMERSARDTAKDPMMPDSPEKLLKTATRAMTKKLVKRFMTE